MSWPIPTPEVITGKAAAVYESTPALAGIDARSANSVAATNCRTIGLTAYDLYLYQTYLGQQLFANTATDDLNIHANIWNVPQLQPTAGTGNGTAAGTVGKNIPSGSLLSAQSGALYMTTAAVAIGSGGTASVPVISVRAGAGYNLPGGTVLGFVSPIGGLNPQSITLDSNGVANGTDLESVESWQARIVAKIQQPPQGGSTADYVEWALAAGAGYVNVVGAYAGAGSVGVIIAAPGPAVASSQLVDAVEAYIANVRPVTARVIVVAATLVSVNCAFTLNPDTADTEAAGLAALQLFFQQSAQIGGTVYMSRLDNALSTGSGVFSFERTEPSADVTMSATQLAILGTVTW